MNNSIDRTWVWQTEDGVYGLVYDHERNILHWYDAVSNLCGDDGSRVEQPLEAYKHIGAPPIVRDVPQAISQALEASIRKLEHR